MQTRQDFYQKTMRVPLLSKAVKQIAKVCHHIRVEERETKNGGWILWYVIWILWYVMFIIKSFCIYNKNNISISALALTPPLLNVV